MVQLSIFAELGVSLHTLRRWAAFICVQSRNNQNKAGTDLYYSPPRLVGVAVVDTCVKDKNTWKHLPQAGKKHSNVSAPSVQVTCQCFTIQFRPEMDAGLTAALLSSAVATVSVC